MNPEIKSVFASKTLWGGLLAGLMLCTIAFAQDAAPAVPITPETQNFILSLLSGLMAKYPGVATFVGIMGSMRLWAKPLCSALHALIEVTPSRFDDGVWATGYKFFTENPVGKFLAYLLDWIGSVKIAPPTKPADPSAP